MASAAGGIDAPRTLKVPIGNRNKTPVPGDFPNSFLKESIKNNKEQKAESLISLTSDYRTTLPAEKPWVVAD
jgi:hypothetical protein